MRIGWKKARFINEFGSLAFALVKLQIFGKVAGHKSRHGINRRLDAGNLNNKSRCGKAKVLEIRKLELYVGEVGEKIDAAWVDNFGMRRFFYRVGKTVVPTNGTFKIREYDDGCGVGIHFFWRKKDAIRY